MPWCGRFIILNKGTITTNKEVRKEQKQTAKWVKRAISFQDDAAITIIMLRCGCTVSLIKFDNTTKHHKKFKITKSTLLFVILNDAIK